MLVSVLGFGGAEIGYEHVAPDAAERLLNEALDAGVNVIDTAECYYESEELIGRSIFHRRDEYYLFTKCGHPDGPGAADWTPDSILAGIERSLRRLQTDRVDLVQLHSCSEEELRRGDVIAALRRARDRGYTRYIGYSGDGRAARYAVVSGAFDTLQTSVSIADQEAIELTLPLARNAQLGVIAKRGLANVAWRHPAAPENAYHRPYWERLRKLDYDFLHGDLEQAVSVALRFTVSPYTGVHTAIVGTAKPGRITENAGLLEAGPLPQAQYDAIRDRWRQVAEPSWTGQM
jgi:aryl-alcohol dehydrogenase-like predicted oxidoreductase